MLITAASVSPACGDMLVGQASIIDGDTIEIHGQRIRMAGIDAPESRQLCLDPTRKEYHCGKVAALALSDRIGRGTVTCYGKERDRYKRLIATCSTAAVDLNAWMVSQGFAVAYRKYSAAYVEQEEDAKAAHRGIWAGEFQMPWDWRQTH